MRCWAVSRSRDYGERTFCSHLPVSVILESRLFVKKSFQFTFFKWEGSEICKLCLIIAQIYAFNILAQLKVVITFLSKTICPSLATQNSDWRPRTKITQVIFSLFALQKFQSLFEMISAFFYKCTLFLCEFSYRSVFAEWKWYKHLWGNRNSAFRCFKLHQW